MNIKEQFNTFLPRNPIKIKGKVKNYDNGRKKIEIKKEIRVIYSLTNQEDTSYLMEHYSELNDAIERLREIYEGSGRVPTLLGFKKEIKEGQNDNA